MSKPFKVGDRVKVIAALGHTHTGDVGTIVRIGPTGDKDGGSFYFTKIDGCDCSNSKGHCDGWRVGHLIIDPEYWRTQDKDYNKNAKALQNWFGD